MKVCVEHCGCVIQFTGWCSDMDLVHLAMRNDVRAFRHATEPIRNDPATALSAVARNGMLLEFASPRLRATRAVIQAAVSQNVFAFQFARLGWKSRGCSVWGEEFVLRWFCVGRYPP